MGVQTIDEFVAGFPRVGGFVYILTNEAHPHLQKIGFTTRSPAERAAELDRTGSAQPFVVAFALYHADPRVAEQRLHAALAAQRVRDEREFFAIPLTDAVAIIMREFGADASYFDPCAITPAGKQRLAQMSRDVERHKLIDDRALKTSNALMIAQMEYVALNERLTTAGANLVRSEAKFLGSIRSAAERREVERLQKEMDELRARLDVLKTEYDGAQDAWRASGGPGRELGGLL